MIETGVWGTGLTAGQSAVPPSVLVFQQRNHRFLRFHGAVVDPHIIKSNEMPDFAAEGQIPAEGRARSDDQND